MSRSYKKNPIIKYGGIGTPKWAKRQANKAVRRHIKNNIYDLPKKSNWYRRIYNPWDIYDLPKKSNWYRRIYNPWDIYDIVSRCSKEEYKSIRASWFNENPTDYDWAKHFYWK